MINPVLSLIEDFAVIALLAIFVYGGLALSNVNKIAISSWNLPTLTSTH